MTSFWHPVSAVCLGDVAAVATPVVLRMMLAADGGAELRYAGDRMEPALRHGSRFRARRSGASGFVPGEAVVAVTRGVPDVYRVDSIGADGVTLGPDADPAETVQVAATEIVARLDLPARRSGRRIRLLRRLALDLREAARHGPDPAVDAAATVRDKYDAQTVFYSAHRGTDLDPRLLEQIRSQVAPGAAILVAGSGAGRESFALAENGYRVTEIDFSAAMVAQARAEAVRTRPREWGATHTRYVAPDGSLHRSFVRAFSPAQLEREVRRAGFDLGTWEGGHGACRRRAR